MTEVVKEIMKKSSMSLYSYHLQKWFQLFNRSQILVLNYDELKNNSPMALHRVHDFIGFEDKYDDDHHRNGKGNNKQANEPKLKQANTANLNNKVSLPSCDIQKYLMKIFDSPNDELYSLLEKHPGPSMEQRPFPKFVMSPKCATTPSSNTTDTPLGLDF